MLVKLVSPAGKVQNIRKTDVQFHLKHGYKYVNEPADLETVEMLSPAGKVVIMKKDVGDYLNREGWSLLESETLIGDEIPEETETLTKDETPEEPEKSVEDEIPVLSTDTAPVEESEPVEADAETINDIPEGVEEADAELEK